MLEKQLKQILSNYPAIRLAILFGSQADGRASYASDVDLAVLADKPLDGETRLKLMEAIGLECGRAADIVDLYEVPEPVTGEVFKGKRLLGDDTVYANLLTRHLLNVADFVPLQQRIMRERREAWIK
jgi:predicted nucleotidyltransferase